jgi:guanosine-3',5'-bis(diphosphate) 3'-pyrophosphohydrolase
MKKEDVVKAKLVAINAHSGQFRKLSNEPYIVHILRITEHITEELKDYKHLNELKVIATLHDLIEDTWITEEFIDNHFGKEILKDVNSLTKDKNLIQPNQEEQYREQLKNASDNAKIIKLFDLYDNFHDVNDVKNKESWLLKIERWKKNSDIINVKDKDLKKTELKLKKIINIKYEELKKILN